MTTVDLWPNQIDGLNAIARELQAGRMRQLVQSATGTGKTTLFGSLPTWPPIAAWLDQFPVRQRKMLVIAHREEHIDQATARIQRLNPNLLVTVEQGDRRASRSADVVVASIQTLAALDYRRLKRLIEAHERFPITIYDECHHASSPMARTALVHLGLLPPQLASDSSESEDDTDLADAGAVAEALAAWERNAPRDRLLVGVTATPNRSDSVGLGCVFQTIAFTYPVKRAIQDGRLSAITPWIVESGVSLDEVKTTAGEFNQKQLAEAVNQSRRNQLAVAAWLEKAQGRSTLAFTVDVAHAHALAAEFQKHGVRAQPISGETPSEERRGLLAAYQAGRVEVLCNAMLLTEGTDLPRTNCIIHAKPTKSALLFEQMTGRGLRIHPGKTDCVVIDVVDVAKKHSLQTIPVLYGLPPGLSLNGDDLQTAGASLEALRARYPTFDVDAALSGGRRLTLKQLQAKAEAFNIWHVPALGVDDRGLLLRWIRTGDQFSINYPWGDGYETMRVQKDMLGHYDVVRTSRGRNGMVRQSTMGAQIPTPNEALSLAEAIIDRERPSVFRLRRTDARWRRNAISDRQMDILKRRGIPYNGKMTAGEASDLLDLYSARSGR